MYDRKPTALLMLVRSRQDGRIILVTCHLCFADTFILVFGDECTVKTPSLFTFALICFTFV
jgi:hypothetical protein